MTTNGLITRASALKTRLHTPPREEDLSISLILSLQEKEREREEERGNGHEAIVMGVNDVSFEREKPHARENEPRRGNYSDVKTPISTPQKPAPSTADDGAVTQRVAEEMEAWKLEREKERAAWEDERERWGREREKAIEDITLALKRAQSAEEREEALRADLAKYYFFLLEKIFFHSFFFFFFEFRHHFHLFHSFFFIIFFRRLSTSANEVSRLSSLNQKLQAENESLRGESTL